MTKLNLNKLKEEIDRRKSAEGMNEGVSFSTPKGKSFLDQLRKSFETGVETESVTKIKNIANQASEKIHEKFGVKEKKPFRDVSSVPTRNHQERNVISEDYEDRENKMLNSFNTANKRTLAEALESQMGIRNQNQQHNQPKEINEQYLINRIDERLDNYLVENIGSIFNESIKNVILEHFTKEKIKEVILDNEGLIKEAVINVIRELQKKKKTT